MNRSARVGSSCSVRIIVGLPIRRMVDTSRAVAVATRTTCPVRQDSPKSSALQNRNDGFLAFGGEHGELDPALLNVEDGVRRISLRKDDLLLFGLKNSFPTVDFGEKGREIERRG